MTALSAMARDDGDPQCPGSGAGNRPAPVV